MSELLNDFENIDMPLNKTQKIDSGENPEIELTQKHSTFFSLSSDDKTNKEKIDNAQKTLDSIYHVCEEQQDAEQKNKTQTNNDTNDHIVMTGTDYHGDRKYDGQYAERIIIFSRHWGFVQRKQGCIL